VSGQTPIQSVIPEVSRTFAKLVEEKREQSSSLRKVLEVGELAIFDRKTPETIERLAAEKPAPLPVAGAFSGLA
jgi:hypothetical protein